VSGDHHSGNLRQVINYVINHLPPYFGLALSRRRWTASPSAFTMLFDIIQLASRAVTRHSAIRTPTFQLAGTRFNSSGSSLKSDQNRLGEILDEEGSRQDKQPCKCFLNTFTTPPKYFQPATLRFSGSHKDFAENSLLPRYDHPHFQFVD
jgi:hypothetical protein